LRSSTFRILVILCLAFAFLGAARAQESENSTSENSPASNDKYDQFIDIKIPDGFVQEPSEESGIFKWKKDGAEIYLVLGDSFVEAPDKVIEALKNGAKSNKQIEEVQDLKLDHGQGFLYKEKAAEDTGRPRLWRIVALTKSKMLNLDFVAPAKDFDKYVNDFQSVVASFQLKNVQEPVNE
jgi:hypothetical protein